MKAVQKASVVDLVANTIVDELAKGTWRVGEKMPTERELSSELKVSRNAVREALRQLQFMGVITIRQGGGIFVGHLDQSAYFKNLSMIFRLDDAGIEDLVEARRSVEGTTSHLAAERALAEDIAALEVIIAASEKVADQPHEFANHDAEFHLRIARASHNSVLFRIVETIRDALFEQQSRIAAIPGTTEASIGYHRRIFEAIRAGNGDLASAVMDDHILNVLKRIG